VDVLNGDLTELTDALMSFYQAERLKDASTMGQES
jgi:hypothetical protein